MIDLYQYQRDYLAGMPAKFIMAADTGTGKSFMALEQYRRTSLGLPLLILAPASKAGTGDWQRDVQAYLGAHDYIVEVHSYEKFTRIPTMREYERSGSRGLWRDWLARYPRGFAMICDEVHRAKNPQSGIGKRVYEVSQACSAFIGLSATPLPNGWIDAANYFKIFGLSRNITEFKARYCDIQTYKGFPEIKQYFRVGELARFWAGIAKPLDKSQALDLPAQTFVPVSLPAGPQYTKLLKERLFDDKLLDNPSALMHALRQSIVTPKVQWLNEFLDGASDNVVVFYNYKSEYEAIMAMLKKSHKDRKVFSINGDKRETPSKNQWSGLRRTITLAQYQSGSTGIELTYCATTVYFSPTYSYSNYEQSIGRTNRNGQTQKMTLYLLCSPSTIEKEIWSSLRNKTDFQEIQWLKLQREN